MKINTHGSGLHAHQVKALQSSGQLLQGLRGNCSNTSNVRSRVSCQRQKPYWQITASWILQLPSAAAALVYQLYAIVQMWTDPQNQVKASCTPSQKRCKGSH
jgi:hypothetical protein